MVEVTEKLALVFWEKIKARAAFYGITPGELCVSCLAYHAGLEQKRREHEEKRRDFSMFHSVGKSRAVSSSPDALAVKKL